MSAQCKTGLVERLRHCSENTRDEYLHELAGRSADAITRLRGYARHDRGCLAIAVTAAGPCTCGLTALLADIKGEG